MQSWSLSKPDHMLQDNLRAACTNHAPFFVSIIQIILGVYVVSDAVFRACLKFISCLRVVLAKNKQS